MKRRRPLLMIYEGGAWHRMEVRCLRCGTLVRDGQMHGTPAHLPWRGKAAA